MPIVGVVNGLDVARLNVALGDVPSGSCRVALAFVDGDGSMRGCDDRVIRATAESPPAIW